MSNHSQENYNLPQYGLPGNPGCYHNFSVGDVDFIMLVKLAADVVSDVHRMADTIAVSQTVQTAQCSGQFS